MSDLEASNQELLKRYHEAKKLLRRCCEAYYRDHYEDGETIDVAISDANQWVSQEDLEDEIFPSENQLLQALEERDAAELAADRLASLVLKEPINWPFHDQAWKRAIEIFDEK